MELYRKNAEPEQLPTPTKIFFSLAGRGASSKRRDPVENINENSQVPDPDLTRFFSSQDSEKHSILHNEITLT